MRRRGHEVEATDETVRDAVRKPLVQGMVLAQEQYSDGDRNADSRRNADGDERAQDSSDSIEGTAPISKTVHPDTTWRGQIAGMQQDIGSKPQPATSSQATSHQTTTTTPQWMRRMQPLRLTLIPADTGSLASLLPRHKHWKKWLKKTEEKQLEHWRRVLGRPPTSSGFSLEASDEVISPQYGENDGDDVNRAG